MSTLVNGKTNHKYIVTKITGEHALTIRLAEMGLSTGKVITVVSPTKNGSGLVIYLAGQRLAISVSLSKLIEVTSLEEQENTSPVPLTDISVHNSCIIYQLNGNKAVRKRLMDMGLTRNTLIQVYHIAPLGDPIELQVRGYKLSIRKSEATQILVKKV